MHKCWASTKALDVFVKELAGLHLRPHPARRSIQQCRKFGTRSSLRQIETASLGTADDGFIPFELTRKLKRSSVGDSVTGTEQHEREASSNSGALESEDTGSDWHADIDIEARVQATKPDPIEPAQVVPTPPTPEWVKPAAQKALSRRQRAMQNSMPAQATSTEARLARKMRRQAEGRYKMPRKDNVEGSVEAEDRQMADRTEQIADVDDDANQVHTVLAKLDQDLGGPSIIKAQQKSAERLAAKSVEKKRKAQLTAAKKQEETRKARSEAEAQRVKKMEPWQRDKSALQRKFGDKGWAPRKRLSPDSLEGIRALHSSDPATYNTPMLSEHFQITPEAIRRILKSKWKPKPEEIEKRMERWEARGVKKWQEMSELGMKPPKKWRMMGVPHPKLETRKKWEDALAEKPVNAKTGKRERWRNLEKHQKKVGTVAEVSLAGRL